MESRATLLGHPVHQMLIVFPLGLLATSVIFDVIFLANQDADMPIAAYWTQAAGIIGGLIAAPFGLIDWMRIPGGTRAKRVGAVHGMGNVIVKSIRSSTLSKSLDRSSEPLTPRPETASRTGPMLTDIVALTDRLKVAPLMSLAVVTSSRRS